MSTKARSASKLIAQVCAVAFMAWSFGKSAAQDLPRRATLPLLRLVVGEDHSVQLFDAEGHQVESGNGQDLQPHEVAREAERAKGRIGFASYGGKAVESLPQSPEAKLQTETGVLPESQASFLLANLTVHTGTGSVNNYTFTASTNVLTVNTSVINSGSTASGSFEVGYYLSTDQILETNDPFIISASVANLNAGTPVNIGVTKDLDTVSGLAAGTYYVFFFIDDLGQVSETDETDNIFYFTTPFIFTPSGTSMPNLAIHLGTGSVNSYSYSSSTQILTVNSSVINSGTASAGSFRVGYYLSLDTIFDSSDHLVSNVTQASLAANANVNLSATQDLDNVSGLPSGTYYVMVIIDDLAQVTESNENDNGIYFNTPILFLSPGSPTLSVSPDFRDVSASSGTTSFSVSNLGTGTMNWSAVANHSWLQITSGGAGTNTGTINLSYSANSGAARTGTITVTASGATGSPKTVEVRQAAAGPTIPDINVTPTSLTIQQTSANLTNALQNEFAVRLKNRQFVPDPAESITLAEIAGNARRHVLLQFTALPALADLAQRDIRPLNYLHNNTLVASVPNNFEARSMAAIRWMGQLLPSDKYSDVVSAELQQLSAANTRTLWVEAFRDIAGRELEEMIANAGARFQAHPSLPDYIRLVTGTSAAFARLAENEKIAWLAAANNRLLNLESVYYCPGSMTPYGPVANFVAHYVGWDGPGLGSAALTYHFDNGTPDIAGTAEEPEVERGLNEWTKYVQITFTRSNSTGLNRSIDIKWASGAHGDNSPFDGPSGVLAHGFFPAPLPNAETIAGDLHFDEAETWSLTGDLHQFSVALHEAGHSIGLDHLTDPNSVMYPTYHGVLTGLTQTDIDAIQSLYASVTAGGNNTFTIQNLGAGTLAVNSISSNRNFLTATGYPTTPFNLAPNASQSVTVNVDWNLVGATTQTGTIAVASNDPDETSVGVLVTAIPSQTTPSITVTAPAAGATWNVGSSQIVTWSSSNVTGSVNIKLSTDGGATFPITLGLPNTANDDTETITAPNNPSTTCRVRVESASNTSVFGNNPGNFTIQTQITPSITVTAPAAGATWNVGSSQTVTWMSSNVTGSVNIKLSTDGGATFPITLGLPNTANDGTETITAPNNPSTTCRVRVESASNTSVFGNNPGNFTIASPGGTCDPATCNGPAIFPVAQGATIVGQTIKAKDGATVCIDIRLKENALPLDAFGFKLQVDPSQLAFVRAEKGDLTTNFIAINAQETPAGSGAITCGGFGTTAIPANSAGVLMRLCFTVKCNTVTAGEIALSAPTDDLVGFAACCNRFECVTCVRDGDLNGDRGLTPGDALCAFQVYLNNGALPASCDAAGFDCEVTASDVNCDNATTPGDALAIFSRYLQNLPPLECFARTASAQAWASAPYQLSLAARTVVSSANNQTLVKVALRVANPNQLSAFGLQLHYPAEQLELLGVTRAALTQDWMQLEGKAHEAGLVRVGGFNDKPIATNAAGELIEVVFASKAPRPALNDFALTNLVDGFAHAQMQNESTSVNEETSAPSAFKLHQSYPNPFKHGRPGSEMSIRFDLPGAARARVELAVYNLAGQLVRQLVSGERRPGAYEITWDGKDTRGQLAPSGTYLYRLKAGGFSESKQLTIVR